MDKPSAPLTESDFVLLDVLARTTHRPEIVSGFRTRAQSCLSQRVTRLQATGRLKELRLAEIILRATSSDAAASDASSAARPGTPAGQNAAGKSLRKTRLRVTRNFMLRPVRTGFEIWSSVSRSHHVLSLELALTLAFFSSGNSVNRLIAAGKSYADRSTAPRMTHWLHETGLLVPVPARSRRPPPESARVTERRTGPANAAASTGPIALDGRVPIYFVPHMPNHFPLALGMMHSFITEHNGGALLEKFCPVPIVYSTAPRDILAEQYARYGQGVWLFSNYMWSVASNLEVSAAVKRHDRSNITIHGGPSTPSYDAACNAFMTKHDSVDIAVHGEGESTIVDLLGSLGSSDMRLDRLHDVNGITFRAASSGADGPAADIFVRTPPRPVIRDLNILPSPYLGGTFASYRGSIDAAIIESNRGCPFGCTFCDWGSATRQKIRKFDLQESQG